MPCKLFVFATQTKEARSLCLEDKQESYISKLVIKTHKYKNGLSTKLHRTGENMNVQKRVKRYSSLPVIIRIHIRIISHKTVYEYGGIIIYRCSGGSVNCYNQFQKQ